MGGMADLRGHWLYSRPVGRMLVFMIKSQPNRPVTDLG